MTERNEVEAHAIIRDAVDSGHGKRRQVFKPVRRLMVPRWVGFVVLAVYFGVWVWAFWRAG